MSTTNLSNKDGTKKKRRPVSTFSERPQDINRNGRPKGFKAAARALATASYIEVSAKLQDGTTKTITLDLRDGTDNKRQTTVAEAIVCVAIEKALKGDIRAAEFIRDTSGEMPFQEPRGDDAEDTTRVDSLPVDERRELVRLLEKAEGKDK